jgi:hypothetical protein
MKPSTTLRYKEKYEFNPLTKSNEIYLTKDTKLINVDGKEIDIVHDIPAIDIYEAFVKYITTALKLSNKAKAVLRYIVMYSKLTDDITVIDMDKLKENTGYNSLGPIYAGFNELIEAQLLARTKYDDQFFINPNFIYDKVNVIALNNKYLIEKYTEAPVPKKKQDLPAGFDISSKIDPGEDF